MFSDVYVPGKGPLEPKICIVGEAPFFEEVEALEPFVGPSGRFLNGILSEAGINRSECWVTNVSKYMVIPATKDRPIPFRKRAEMSGVDLDKCIAELWNEIRSLNPSLILALGGTALWALTGKTKIQSFRGSILNADGYKLIATYHPAHILHQDGEVKGYWNKQVMVFDLRRAKEQSSFRDIILPQRNLQICQSSSQLQDFIRRRAIHNRPAIDIEAVNCFPVCIGIAYDRHEGLTIPLWNHDGISNIPDSDLAVLWIDLALLLSKAEAVGANFGYDRDKIKKFGFIVRRLFSDVMLKAFVLNPELPKNLAFNTSVFTLEPYYKDEGMYEGSLADLFIGCAKDACVTKEVDEEMDGPLDRLGLRDFYNNFVLPLHNVYHYRSDNTAIEQVGFAVNENKRMELLQKYIEWNEKTRYDLAKIAGEVINPGSNPQVKKLLFEKWNLPLRKTTGEEDLTSLLNTPQFKDEAKKLAISLILEARRVKKTIDTYCYALPDYNGRMKTSYFLCLDTGRSSTQQQEPPIRPAVKYSTKDEYGRKVTKRQALGNAFQTMTKHGDIGPDVRSMYECDEGHIFIQADSSQAEARVIFILAEDYDALRDIDEHDYHALTASWFVGGTEEDWSKKLLGYEHPNRFLGKTLRHAGHLGASGRRAATEVNTQARKYGIDVKINEALAVNALKVFHAKQPKIKQIFQRDVIKCLETNKRALIAPTPFGIDCAIGGRRTFFERWGDELFRQAFSYLPQRTVSENTKGAALRIRGAEDFGIIGRGPWIKIILESHDALLAMVPIERKQEAGIILKEELERPIDFSSCSLPRGKLIIPCELEEGYNYKDLSKFKWI